MKSAFRKLTRSNRAQSSEFHIRTVMALEREVWRAARDRNAERFAELVPADAVMIFRSGMVTQPDYIAGMRDRSLLHSKIEDLRGNMPNAKTIILTYRTVRAGSYKGKAFPSGSVVESTVWIKRGKRWVAILNQETPLQG